MQVDCLKFQASLGLHCETQEEEKDSSPTSHYQPTAAEVSPWTLLRVTNADCDLANQGWGTQFCISFSFLWWGGVETESHRIQSGLELMAILLFQSPMC